MALGSRHRSWPEVHRVGLRSSHVQGMTSSKPQKSGCRLCELLQGCRLVEEVVVELDLEVLDIVQEVASALQFLEEVLSK